MYLVDGSEKYLVLKLETEPEEAETAADLVTGALTKAGEKGDKGKDKDKDKDSDSSSSESSNSPSSGEDSAQPGSPSSNDDDTLGSDTEPSDSGADQSEQSSDGTSEETSPGNPETPPQEVPVEEPSQEPTPEEIPAEIPAEQPVEEQPVEEIPPAEEIPAEEVPAEIPEEIPIEENITEEILPENLTEEIIPEILPEVQTFENECVDTCLLPDGLDADHYELEIEVTNGELTIDEISYSLLDLTEIPITIAVEIKDSNNETVPANVTILDENDVNIEEVEGEQTTLQTLFGTEVSAENAHTFETTPEKAKKLVVDIQDSENPVESIEFNDLTVTDDTNIEIGIDDVPETVGPAEQTIMETYAIDPTALNFETATATVTATGTQLYKCKDWSFEQQVCNGEWIFLQSITPGESYTLNLTPDDPAFSETQQPNGAGKDTWISSTSTNENNGANDILRVKSTSGDNRILLQFDLSNIPSNAIITNATVTLYRESGSDNGAENISLYRLTRYWDEGTGVIQQSGDGATWSNATNTTAWTTAGGDYAATEIARTSVTVDGYYTWAITSTAQGWVNGTWSNYGLLFANSVNADDANAFTSGDDTIAAQRPQFNVSYTTALNITFVSPTPDNSATLNQSWVYVNASMVNGNASAAKLEWNGTNYTMSGSGTNWYLNKTNLTSGNYTYKVYANDSQTNVFDVSEARTVTVNACTANMTNTSWSSWSNLSCAGSQMNQTRSKTEYDSNACGFVNVTHYEYQLVGPAYANTSWSFWYNITACMPGDYYTQEKNATQYDSYACAANSTVFEYQNLSCTYNRLPVATTPSITPATAYTNNDLNCSFTITDADAGNSLSANYTWYNGSIAIIAGTMSVTNGTENSIILSAGNTTKTETWNCTVIPYDDLEYGIAKSATKTITNSLPTAPVVDVIPNVPADNEDLVATIATASTDLDNDSITYAYQWYKNDVLQVGQTANTLSNLLTTIGDTWKCIVTPNDGTGNGATGQDSVTINGSATQYAINLISPSNGATWSSSNTVTFQYNTTLNATNCSLVVNDAIDQTDNNITANVTESFVSTLSNAGYTWSVNCTDVSNITNSSATWALTVSYSTGGRGHGGSGSYYPPAQNTTNVSVPFWSNLTGLLSGEKANSDEGFGETENEISSEVTERTSSITGAATEVRAYKVPSPVYAVPTLLLLVLLFAILSLKKTDIPEKAKKILTALHAALITSIIALLFFTFIKAPAITGGAVTVGKLQVHLTQENLLIIIPLALVIISSVVLYYINEKYATDKKIRRR